MPSDIECDALFDIRDNILWAQEFGKGLTLATFTASRLHVYAVTRCLEIISEASRRLSQDLRDRHSHLPWRGIMDAGNVYRHRYDNVAESFVWTTLQDHLSALLDAVQHEIENLAPDP